MEVAFDRKVLDLLLFITVLLLSSLKCSLAKEVILHSGMNSWNEHVAFPRVIRVRHGKQQQEKPASQEVMDEAHRSEQDIPTAPQNCRYVRT